MSYPQNTDTHTVHIAISTLTYHINQNRTACTGSTALQAGLPLGPQYESGMPTGPSARIWNAIEPSVRVWNAYRALSSYLECSRVLSMSLECLPGPQLISGIL